MITYHKLLGCAKNVSKLPGALHRSEWFWLRRIEIPSYHTWLHVCGFLNLVVLTVHKTFAESAKCAREEILHSETVVAANQFMAKNLKTRTLTWSILDQLWAHFRISFVEVLVKSATKRHSINGEQDCVTKWRISSGSLDSPIWTILNNILSITFTVERIQMAPSFSFA